MLNSTEGFRLSPQQTSLWSLQQTAEKTFCALYAIELQGKLEPDILRAALDQLVQRHEILRTVFRRPTGFRTPFQVVLEDTKPSWQKFDLSGLSADEQQVGIKKCLDEARSAPFDLEQGPMLRVALVKLSPLRHLLIISLPALCADSRTLTNIAGELCQAYQSESRGAESGEPMQYADFAEWQNELLEATDDLAREGKQYWQEQHASSPVLPLERKSVASGADFNMSAVSFTLDAELLKKIEALAGAEEVSLSTALFACWRGLVWRLSGAADFVLFDGFAGRKFADLQDALGPYARHLPVHCVGEDVEISELVRTTHSKRQAADEWQEYFDPTNGSFALDEAIAFEFVEQPQEFAAAEPAFSLFKLSVSSGPWKLKLTLFRSGDALTGELQYDAQRFADETIERFAGYFQKVAQTSVCDSEVAQTLVCDSGETDKANEKSQTEVYATRIGTIDLLSDEERDRLLVEFNQTTAVFPTDKYIHELFEDQVAKTPEATALVFNDQELTYAQLNARANRLAHLLRSHGLAPNDRVGLCTDRGVEMIVGLLAILKAGGAYVPLNPEHPKERLALQLAESQASLLVTAAGTIDEALQFGGETPGGTIDLLLHESLLANEPDTNPAPVATPANLVYVIYTSGSTGIPKGVAVSHGNLANYTQFILRRLAVTQPLQFASVSTISADLGNTCIFPSLVSGGCLHLLSYEAAMSGELFREYTTKRPIDVLKIVPSHLNALLAGDAEGKFLPARYLICGGEALSWELVHRLGRLNPTCRIINHYGPTETTVGSLTYDVDKDEPQPDSLTVPIGRPIANTSVFVLDKYLRPTPAGVAGELFIGGAGVARGYLNQPLETAARFVADPFTSEPGARLYRTGDLARYLPDGNIEFLGRVDHQVKVRGFRVELGEVEAVLASHPNIQQPVVVALNTEGSSREQRLVAYLVALNAKPPATDELRSLLRLKLPDYMVPAAFVFLKTMPLTANGKIDRGALPAPDDLRPELEKVFVAPRTVVETELAGIWAGLLKVSEVGVYDNFFDLGGHSLLATQVVSRMRQTFQVEISLRSLFESPTVAALAAQIENAAADETAQLLAELEQLSEEEAELLLKQEERDKST